MATLHSVSERNQAGGDGISASSDSLNCRLVHHGAAADSSSKVLTWLPPTSANNNNSNTTTNQQEQQDCWGRLVYASHAMINVAQHKTVQYQQQQTIIEEPLWNVTETLRTHQSYSTSPTEKPPIITALTALRPLNKQANTTTPNLEGPTLVCGFSNGTLTVWNQTTQQNNGNSTWEEQVLVDGMKENTDQEKTDVKPRSVTDVSGLVWHDRVLVVSGSSDGVMAHTYNKNGQQNEEPVVSHWMVSHHTASTVQLEALSDTTVLVLVGTAAPRHNKILIYSLFYDDLLLDNNNKKEHAHHHFCGALTGHEDWITCFAWQSLAATSYHFMLASGSQDFRIRLWKFMTSTTTTSSSSTRKNNLELPAKEQAKDMETSIDIIDEEEVEKEEEDYEEHESRMEILWKDNDTDNTLQTSVSLEALLLGHEEPVTAVHWYPTTEDNPTSFNQDDNNNLFLLSSSMDRSILIWSPSEDDGIWTPITRVGSAGGILGGSIGSTLLGYVNFQIMPHCLVGHAYGGALHVWHRGTNNNSLQNWKATPCVTGHFNGVTDLCWESTFGDYLLTASIDQTCRLWAQVDTADDHQKCWVEVARPQVHGYDLTAITSLSSHQHRHWMVSCADEKEIRILDAPMTTLRMLQAVITSNGNVDHIDKENAERVERAYIPSLGLSNKASAADGAEEDLNDDDASSGGRIQQKAQNLPLERDLGAMSLWLEKRKLFGHNTELFCVTSTLEAKTARDSLSESNVGRTLVASAAKARDVEAASIRIWDPLQSTCLQTLAGGHKSTVATLSFSADNGKYLASSGKDRRLCVWKQTNQGDQLYSLAAAKDSAHKRIIWSVHFCPFDPTVLASGSRDGNIKIWKLSDNEDNASVDMATVFSFAPFSLNPNQKPDSVTSLAFAPRSMQESLNGLLAVGLECGLIELWSIPMPTFQETRPETAPTLLRCFPPSMCHVAAVTQLAWRPLRQDGSGKETLTLASCSMDHGCRIFEVSNT